MQFQKIHIVITKEGQVEIKVEGATGTSCLDLTRALEEALGGGVLSREMKPEAYETTTQNSNTQRIGT